MEDNANFIPLGGNKDVAPFDKPADASFGKVNTKKFARKAVGPRGPKPAYDGVKKEKVIGATPGRRLWERIHLDLLILEWHTWEEG